MSLPVSVTSFLDGSIGFIYSLQPLCEKTVILVPDVLKQQVSEVADLVGMDSETINYVLGLFLCYPLGFIMLQIPFQFVQVRHLFSLFLGVFLLQFTVGAQWIHQLISSLIAYAMIIMLPRSTLKTVLPAFSMIYLTLGHLHRIYVNYLGWDLDFTGPQMVLTMKLYMIAYNLFDGEQLVTRKAGVASKKCAPFALKKHPTILEFLGYTFCFSNVLVGPAFEYNVYRGIIDGSIMKGPDREMKKPPSNVWPTLRPLLTSLLCLLLYLVLSERFPLLDPQDPQKNTPVVITPDFLEYSWFYRVFCVWMGTMAFRHKYYFGWKNAEGAQNIWYAGFEGFNNQGKPKGWETSVNMNILGFEFAPDIQTCSKEWNKKTASWLSRYVYIRNGGNLLAVYALSAFWHGFYPGYYLSFFLTLPILTMCDRLAKKKLSPYFPKSKWTPYGIASMISTSLAANYAVTGFCLLAFSWSFELFKSLYFAGHVIPIIYYIILTLLPTPIDKEKKKSS